MPPAYEVLLLNTAIPQIQAAQSGDTYVVPRDIAFSTVASFAAGAEATPSIVATGDTNTGIWFPAADTVAISTGGISRLRLDASGNLGLGVTPSAWSGYTALQVGSGFTAWSSGVANARINANTYYNGGYKYAGTGTATMYEQDGYHAWYTAASGNANDPITFTQAMTLDASGNLGVGTTSPGTRLHIETAAADCRLRIISGTSHDAAIQLGDTASASQGAIIYDNTVDALRFQANGSERARITSGGNLDLQNNLGLGGASATTSGTGITFPATQSASSNANTLDDYEEGTWTPGFAFNAGATGITYTVQAGKYTKIGNSVTCTGRIVLSNKGSSTGVATLTGLPFAAGSGDEDFSAASILPDTITYTGSLLAINANSATTIRLYSVTEAGVATQLTDADFSNSSQIIVTITYLID